MVASRRPSIEIDLNAAIVTVETRQPLILVVRSSDPREPDGLPFGPFDPLTHRTFETGLRAWVAEQTALKLGYVEQLYTFGDHGRHDVPGDAGPHLVSVGYLALTRPSENSSRALAKVGALWRRWYEYFPWEDWREGRPDILDNRLMPALKRWARARPSQRDAARPLGRRERLRLAFGEDGGPWDEERVLERYELLYGAGLVAEAPQYDQHKSSAPQSAPLFGVPMHYDHRRILATAISRLRAKLKYRPVIFELMPVEILPWTDLQRTVEAISGRHLHKQKFFAGWSKESALLEPIGKLARQERGRPAELFRFRREVLKERPAPGLRVGTRA